MLTRSIAIVLLFIAAFVGPVSAQEPASTEVLALRSKLNEEFSAGIQLRQSYIALSQQLDAAKKEIEELKKAAPKKD